jgi:prepilin-type N-terminal cleavage/methylation domain-containing protein
MTIESKKGFTLIEFLITVTLIGILTAFFLPQYTKFSKRQTLKTAAEETVTFVEGARNKALSGVQGATNLVVAYGVFYFGGQNSLGLYRKVNPNGESVWELTALDQFNFPSELKITWPAENPVFSVPTGRLSGVDRVIVVCYDNIGKYEISIKATGVVSLGERADVAECP